MPNYIELSDEDLNNVVGGVITRSWDGDIQLGTITSDECPGEVYHYVNEHYDDVKNYINTNRSLDRVRINYMLSMNWIYKAN